jgi:hypothetical protein
VESTYEQRMAVKRDECRMAGHTFSEIVAHQSLGPQAIFCSNCGVRWRIHPDDLNRDFGEESHIALDTL